jgi:hypothetical protein
MRLPVSTARSSTVGPSRSMRRRSVSVEMVADVAVAAAAVTPAGKRLHSSKPTFAPTSHTMCEVGVPLLRRLYGEKAKPRLRKTATRTGKAGQARRKEGAKSCSKRESCRGCPSRPTDRHRLGSRAQRVLKNSRPLRISIPMNRTSRTLLFFSERTRFRLDSIAVIS